jgi:hypothetical protein
MIKLVVLKAANKEKLKLLDILSITAEGSNGRPADAGHTSMPGEPVVNEADLLL